MAHLVEARSLPPANSRLAVDGLHGHSFECQVGVCPSVGRAANGQAVQHQDASWPAKLTCRAGPSGGPPILVEAAQQRRPENHCRCRNYLARMTSRESCRCASVGRAGADAARWAGPAHHLLTVQEAAGVVSED